uniref:Uncharacterized protein n=1 Tax=Equus caballus TaxID=9796 RepID=A0A9L0TAZ0_HORSE
MLDVDAQKPLKWKWPTTPLGSRFLNQNQTRKLPQEHLGTALERAHQGRPILMPLEGSAL